MQPNNRAKRDLSLRDVLLVLRRQRLTIAVVFILCLVAGAVAFRMTKAAFKTSVRILVEGPTVSATKDEASEISVQSSGASVSTQIQILESGKMLNLLGFYEEFDPNTPKISAAQQGETSALLVSIEAADPGTAQRVAENLGGVYTDYLTKSRDEEIDKGLEYLVGRRNKFEEEYKQSLKALQDEKSGRKLAALDNEGTIRASHVTQTENDVETREAEIAADEKRLAVIESQKAGLPKGAKVKSVRPNTAEIETQKGVLESLKAQRAGLLQQWKEGTPKIVEIDAEIKEQQQRLNEIPPIVDESTVSDDPLKNSLYSEIAGAKADLASARVKKNMADQSAQKALNEFLTYSKLEPNQTKLTTEVTEARNHLLDAEQSVDALNLKKSQRRDPVQVLGAPTPSEKVRPILPQYIVISLLTGLIFSVGLALLKDNLQDKVNSPDEVFQLCGLEPLAQMPRMPSLTSGASASTAITRIEPAAELFDSYRLLRFNLLNAAERGYMGSLVITSATGSEGKSDLAADLASVMAASGRKVILVDANLRNPSVARRFGLSERPGMTDVLIGEAPLEAALVPTNIAGLHVLPAGAKTTNPVDLLESSQMVSMHARLRELADLVIFDAPSCLSFADVSVLASFTDSVIMVAELGTTKRDLLNRGVNLLQRSSARLVGVVLRDQQPTRKRGRRKAA